MKKILILPGLMLLLAMFAIAQERPNQGGGGSGSGFPMTGNGNMAGFILYGGSFSNVNFIGTFTADQFNIGTMVVSNGLPAASGGTGITNYGAGGVVYYPGGTNNGVVLTLGPGFTTNGNVLSYTNVNFNLNTNLILSSNAATTPVLTFALPTNGVFQATYALNEAGQTNNGSWPLSSATIRSTPSGATIVMVTNMQTNFTKGCLASNGWTVSGNNATFSATGMTNEYVDAQIIGNYVFTTNGVPIPTLTCTTFANNLSLGQDNLTSSSATSQGYISQPYTFSTTQTNCSYHLGFYQGQDRGPWTIEIRTAANRGGSLVGTASISEAVVDGGDGFGDQVFTWTSNPVISSGTYYITPIPTDTGNTININCVATPASGMGAVALIGTTPQTGKYMTMTISTMQ